MVADVTPGTSGRTVTWCVVRASSSVRRIRRTASSSNRIGQLERDGRPLALGPAGTGPGRRRADSDGHAGQVLGRRGVAGGAEQFEQAGRLGRRSPATVGSQTMPVHARDRPVTDHPVEQADVVTAQVALRPSRP